MENVIETLKYIAKHDGYWGKVTDAGVWYRNLNGARSYSYGGVGFTKDDLREFLKHYEELSNKIGQLGEVING